MNPNTVMDEIASDKLTLTCGDHRYTAARRKGNLTYAMPPETRGCANCWKVYYITDLALTDPSKRQERLDELESVIHHAIEFEQKGKFGDDLELYNPTDSRFKVEIEKDAE